MKFMKGKSCLTWPALMWMMFLEIRLFQLCPKSYLSEVVMLKHWGLNKMVHILQRTFFMGILLKESLHLDLIFIEFCSQGFNWQYVSFGSGNGLVPRRWQAMTWTNADPIHWSINVSPDNNCLYTHFHQSNIKILMIYLHNSMAHVPLIPMRDTGLIV